MLATVRFQLPDGSTTTLAPGDIIGRMASAALVLDDGRVSEAHAMVSLRGAELHLLSLRGMFAVDGRPTSKLVLAAGQRLGFATDLELVVDAVVLPATLPALSGDGLPAQALGGTASLWASPPPRLVPGHAPDAHAWLWSTGARWRLRIGDADARDLGPGEEFRVGGRGFRLATLQVERAGVDATESHGRVGGALELVAGWDVVQIKRAGQPPVVIGGVAARILSTLAAVDAALSWEGVAHEVWGAETDPQALRRRLDVALSRLRARLRGSNIRTDLVRSTGAGHLELVRYPGDVVIDRT